MTDHDILQAMRKFGGSFVSKLAELYGLADTDNQQRIKTAWPEYWERYAELAKLAEEQGRLW